MVPAPSRISSENGTVRVAAVREYRTATAPRTAIVPRFSRAGAAAASANRRCAFITAVAVATTPYSGTWGRNSRISTAASRAWPCAAVASAAPAEPSRSSQGAATATAGTKASMPSTATPSSPPAVRAVARRSPASMWCTSAGISREENIDPASSP